MVHTMLGALAPKGGPTFIGKAFFGDNKESEEESGSEDFMQEDKIMDYAFPESQHMQERVQPMRQKLLEARK